MLRIHFPVTSSENIQVNIQEYIRIFPNQDIQILDTSFLTASFFTTSLNLLKSTGIGTNLSMSNLSTSVFRLAKLVFTAKLEVSTCEIFLISVFVA